MGIEFHDCRLMLISFDLNILGACRERKSSEIQLFTIPKECLRSEQHLQVLAFFSPDFPFIITLKLLQCLNSNAQHFNIITKNNIHLFDDYLQALQPPQTIALLCVDPFRGTCRFSKIVILFTN
jgi:hypothetical protein